MTNITKIEDFFDEKLFFDIVEYSVKILSQDNNNFKTNYMWPNNIVRDSFPVLIHLMDPNGDLNQKIQQNVLKKIGLTPIRVMLYYFTRMSHIPWHNDSGYENAMTVYLNETWNMNTGGAFLYMDPDVNNIKAIYPKRNVAVLQKGGTQHAVLPTTATADMRVTLQMFFKSETHVII